MAALPMRWELDSIYEGGSGSEAFARELEQVEKDIKALILSLKEAPDVTAERLTEWTASAQSVLTRMREAGSFTACLTAANTADRQAVAVDDRVKNVLADFHGAMTAYDRALGLASDELWREWLAGGTAGAAAFYANERREAAKEKLPPEQEALAAELAVNGYHGWGDLYNNTIVGRARFEAADETGEKKVYSAGQLHNLLSHGDRGVRTEAFRVWEEEWGRQAELCADALNRIAGFRLKLYERRGWHSVLKEPLQMNRMSEDTLQAMWSAIGEGKPALVRYMERKAKLFGLERLDWHDVAAPVGSASPKMPYDDAAELIADRFRAFSPDMADFALRAFSEGWIEAEDRAGKRPGGFCTSLPVSGQTRIFMTYSGTPDNVSTLAHELGHAYHQHVMNDLPPFAQEYAMNVAETASTFAELIVADSAVEAAQDRNEKLALLDDKLQSSVAFFMNIHARFLFETRFYERRRSGLVAADELSAMMEEAQREAYAEALGLAHPNFWASKLHFFLTDVPFYNFPYTFGYLFSAGIYARAKAEGPAFASRYVALLRDTGSMNVEELARKHLGVRLDDTAFWREAVAGTEADAAQFLAMTE
ncbi:oligoendopeptidase [Paenibacillus darwinianus]|uniref:Oligoendopeptidase n=2 Tax=Paenibacillus darwinianus TaxID=1380763 RepID=A0A9W5S2R3_9BACL|nr:M3 family oligoendopeptidase [Paenibacillus darwinianus]EXX89668.1 oligoendopeptidase [Paenibacillus darwinianus]EXX89958.1 oligoendopeptidase [Paenibacillus darwinianus]